MYDLEEYDENTLKHIQNVQLMILKDFIEICETNDIEYMAYGGTLLGAIRHEGFIPWDDDTDVIMLREEYEKFVKVMNSKENNKYSLFNLENTEEFFYFMAKFSLNGTEFSIDWTKNTSYKLGICLDIFIFDDVPDNKISRWIYYKKMKFISAMMSICIVDLNKNYPSFFKKIITIVGSFFMKIFNLKPQFFKNSYKKLVNSNNNRGFSHVYENIAQTYTEPIPKEILHPLKKVKFENIEINVPYDYDKFLTILYGDYMTLPPIDERQAHPHYYIDFGNY